MRTIELSGIPGSGKSTILPVVARYLRAGGCDVVDQEHLIYRTQTFPFNSQTLQWLLDVAPRRLRSKYTKALTNYCHSKCDYPIQYLASHLPLLRYLSAVIDERPIPQSHKSLLIRRFFKLAGEYEMASACLSQDAVFLCDEGFVHRATSLYVSLEEAMPDPSRVEQYLDYICPATVLIHVTADVETCERRVVARGVPKRLDGSTARDVRDYLTKSKQVGELAVRHVADRGGQVVVVDNSHEPFAVGQIEQQLATSNLARWIHSDETWQERALEHAQ